MNPSSPALCLPCGDLNLLKRKQTADMRGYRCLVTGGRTKVGFEAALKLLRAGATVTITTRFENDARDRFAQQPDSDAWTDCSPAPGATRLVDGPAPNTGRSPR